MNFHRASLVVLYISCIVVGRQKDESSSESPLSKFFREPQLGTSWYNPGGPTPTFQVYKKFLGQASFCNF